MATEQIAISKYIDSHLAAVYLNKPIELKLEYLKDEFFEDILANQLFIESVKQKDVDSIDDCKQINKEAALNYAEKLYQAGRYNDASNLLFFVQSGIKQTDTKFLWACVSADLLAGKHQQALFNASLLNNAIEKSKENYNEQKLWFIHYSLFICSNLKNFDFFLELSLLNLNLLSTQAVHLIKFVSLAALLTKKRKLNIFKEISKVLKSEDPSFLNFLVQNCDFTKVGQKIEQLALESDYFFKNLNAELVDAAKVSFIEVYCKINSKLDFKEFPFLEVSLLQQAKVDGNLSNKIFTVSQSNLSISQLVTDKVKVLAQKTAQISSKIR